MWLSFEEALLVAFTFFITWRLYSCSPKKESKGVYFPENRFRRKYTEDDIARIQKQLDSLLARCEFISDRFDDAVCEYKKAHPQISSHQFVVDTINLERRNIENTISLEKSRLETAKLSCRKNKNVKF